MKKVISGFCDIATFITAALIVTNLIVMANYGADEITTSVIPAFIAVWLVITEFRNLLNSEWLTEEDDWRSEEIRRLKKLLKENPSSVFIRDRLRHIQSFKSIRFHSFTAAASRVAESDNHGRFIINLEHTDIIPSTTTVVVNGIVVDYFSHTIDYEAGVVEISDLECGGISSDDTIYIKYAYYCSEEDV